MVNVKLVLLVSLVLAILSFLGILVSGASLKQRINGFTDKANTFTLYYMNGCPHCETLLPAYKEFVAAGDFEFNGVRTQIRMLEQGDPAAAREIDANNVKGYPTFILKKASGGSMEYKGDRTVAAMKEFIQRNAS
jgi:thiol-disulfide isomerase/thioredoxin